MSFSSLKSVRDMGELHGGQSGIWASFMVVTVRDNVILYNNHILHFLALHDMVVKVRDNGRASWWSVRDMGELHGGQSGIWIGSTQYALRHSRGGIPETNSVEGVPFVTEIPSAATKATLKAGRV